MFDDLKIGDIDPNLGKKIKEIILSSDKCIVYIDDDTVIQWVASGITDINFGNIANQISYWESLCNRLFEKEDTYEYKCLLAEGYARILDDGNKDTAQEIINKASKRISIHGKEVLRQKYLISSLYSTALVALLLILAVLLRHNIKEIISIDGFEVLLTSIFGGIGAFISTVTRAKKYNAEITVGKKIHEIDGILRIVYGIIAGGIIGLGIKANIVFGFINDIQSNNIFVMTFLGAVGGASEMVIPSIIKQIEDKV